MSRVLFHVQHLLGVGHQRRSAAIARALAGRDVTVDYVSGGFPVTGLDIGLCRFHQLEPVRARDGNFQVLEDVKGQRVDEVWARHRRDQLLALLTSLRPSLIVIETYPFGRRGLRIELEAMLAWAKTHRAVLLSSVRDVIEPRDNRHRREQMAATLRAHFAGVMVHGDPALLPFRSAFPEFDRIAHQAHYTGYVVSAPPPEAPSQRTGPVLVSCGGGRVGESLLASAIEARALGRFNQHAWRFRTGTQPSEGAVARLSAMRRPGIEIVSDSGGFLADLSNARVSVSQAGYNTVAEVLATATPAVLVPYAGQREQSIRASALGERGMAQVVRTLSPRCIARALDEAGAQASLVHDVRLNGVACSVKYILDALRLQQ